MVIRICLAESMNLRNRILVTRGRYIGGRKIPSPCTATRLCGLKKVGARPCITTQLSGYLDDSQKTVLLCGSAVNKIPSPFTATNCSWERECEYEEPFGGLRDHP